MTSSFTPQLLAWYQENKRDLPWRFETPNPYHTWLSEVMLQQTTVATVIPYYDFFVKTWPRVEDLASAPLDDVLHAWQGLGYYSRARNLHRCAQEVVTRYGGQFPDSLEGLRSLPGIGPYSAGAILSIGFQIPAIAIDGNVLRVMGRYGGIPDPRPLLDKRVEAILKENLSDDHPGDFTQALMELGATVCRPKSPLCLLCPLKEGCVARTQGNPEDYPFKEKKEKLPTKYAAAYVLEREDGALWLQKRPTDQMLGGMMAVPTSPWELTPVDADMIQTHAPLDLNWQGIEGVVKHTFSHFHFEISVVTSQVQGGEGPLRDGQWVSDPKDVALPTVMKKILQAASKRARMGA